MPCIEAPAVQVRDRHRGDNAPGRWMPRGLRCGPSIQAEMVGWGSRSHACLKFHFLILIEPLTEASQPISAKEFQHRYDLLKKG